MSLTIALCSLPHPPTQDTGNDNNRDWDSFLGTTVSICILLGKLLPQNPCFMPLKGASLHPSIPKGLGRLFSRNNWEVSPKASLSL